MAQAPGKFCTKCGEYKTLSRFGQTGGGKRRSHCKECHCKAEADRRQRNPQVVADQKKREYARNSERYRAYQREYRRKHPERVREMKLRIQYGMTSQEWDALHEAQGGRCAICRRPSLDGKPLRVDHDHKTGAVRGLLCSPCNTGLGQFQDEPKRLEKAAEYLRDANLRQGPERLPA